MRPQPVVLPILRAALPGVAVVSFVPDVDYRTFPLISIRREGGTRSQNLPRRYSHPAIELSAYSADGPVEAEELYDDAIEALYTAVRQQITVEGAGHLQSLPEADEATQAPSEVPDTWKATGSVRLGVRAA